MKNKTGEEAHPCDNCPYGKFAPEDVEDAIGHDPCKDC